MKGYGLLIIIAVVTLTLVIVVNTCTNWTYEGFQEKQKQKQKPVPEPLSLGTNSPVTVADLPSVPSSVSETNPLPQQDPAMEKSTVQMLEELKQDMDGFYKNEYNHIKDRSDPAINLPLTRFQGDYQRVKDELSVLKANPGIRGQISIQEVNDVGANLRYLQKIYRDLANVELVPASDLPYSRVGVEKEGFTGTGYSEDEKPITLTQLKLLSTSISAEIVRLKSSGTTDPVITARVNIFTKISQTVTDLITRIGNGSLTESAIPIKVKDYNSFLPALGDSSAGIGGLLSSSGLGSLSNLFNAYDVGDASGAEVAAVLFDRYAKDMLKGVSFSLSYTSKNDVEKQKALASYATAYKSSKLFPGKEGARGEFDETVRDLHMDGFETNRPPSVLSGNPGHFDWKGRVDAITDNIRRAGMNPSDFGCLEPGVSVSSAYSWRGHARMVCNRLATNADPAIPEQMGCPPVSWKGWRS
jgi:hypothetical protein